MYLVQRGEVFEPSLHSRVVATSSANIPQGSNVRAGQARARPGLQDLRGVGLERPRLGARSWALGHVCGGSGDVFGGQREDGCAAITLEKKN